MIWKQNIDLDSLNDHIQGTMVEHIGIKFEEIGPDFIKASMPVDHRTFQPMKILHGGASVVLSETLGSIASQYCLDDPIHKVPVGIEINANHLRMANHGSVIGIVKPVRIGRTIMVWNTEIYDHASQLVCTSRLTCMIIEKK